MDFYPSAAQEQRWQNHWSHCYSYMSKAQNHKINYYHCLRQSCLLLQYLVASVWHLTFALEIQEKSMFWITQVQGIGLSSIFLRAQHCHCLQLIWSSISYWLFRLDTMISEPDSFASLGKWVKGGSDNFKLPSALDCQATYLNILPDHFKT